MALVSVQQAAANALATFLGANFTSNVVVEPQWPDPDKKLPAQAVTVLKVGKRRDIATMGDDAPIVNQTVIDAKTIQYTWAVAFCAQDYQLDVWSREPIARDDILAQLDQILHTGLSSMGPTAPAVTEPYAGSLLLPLATADGWSNSFVEFVFEGAETDDSPEAIRNSEFRATVKGTAWMNLHITATTPRMLSIILKQRLSEIYAPGDPGDAQPYGTATTNASGSTFTL